MRRSKYRYTTFMTSAAGPWAITTERLTKRYADDVGWRIWQKTNARTVVDEVTLQVERGEFFGLLGPNGAGKTTLVKMLCTLVIPTSGSATIMGFPLSAGQEIRRRVGLTVTDERSFYWRLTGRQNLHFFASLHGLFGQEANGRIDSLLSGVDLQESADRRFSSYSSGMKQRLAIARALIAEPELLVLDEPTRSLDPVATQQLHELILGLQTRRQMTVFLITHDLSEAEKLCQRVAIMHRGRILAQERPRVIRERLAQKTRYRIQLDHCPPACKAALQAADPFLRVNEETNGVTLAFAAGEGDSLLDQLLAVISGFGVKVKAIETEIPSLEEAFQEMLKN